MRDALLPNSASAHRTIGSGAGSARCCPEEPNGERLLRLGSVDGNSGTYPEPDETLEMEG